MVRTFILILSLSLLAPSAYSAQAWIARARKVGQSETAAARDSALASLRKQKNLAEKLTKALDTKDRPLALDAIGALPMKNLIPELQNRVPTDSDGFLILTLSSLLDNENKDSVLKTYTETLNGNIESVSAGAIVAMLEPLGRLGEQLSKETLTKLEAHAYPEVRSSLLSYLRVLTLTHNKRDNDAMITKALAAPEFQLRLQAVSIIKEISLQAGRTPIIAPAELDKHCQKEAAVRVKEQCLTFLRRGQP